MTCVWFIKGATQRSANCRVSRTWKMAASGEAGECTIEAPISLVDTITPYINFEGGSTIVIPSVGFSGPWIGVATSVENNGDSLTVHAIQPHAIFGQRHVASFAQAPLSNIGFIWYRAAVSALGSIASYPLFVLSSHARTSPVINYDFRGQDLQSVSNDLMSISGGEVILIHSAQTRSVYAEWQGINSRAVMNAVTLVEGGHLQNVKVQPEVLLRVTRVTARDRNGSTYTSYIGDVAAQGWPAEAVVQYDDTDVGGLGSSAESEMFRLSMPATVVQFTIPRKITVGGLTVYPWNMQERYFVRLNLTHHRSRGATVVGRILERTLDDDGDMQYTAAVVYDPNNFYLLKRQAWIGAIQRASASVGRVRDPLDRQIVDIRRQVSRLRLNQ